MSLAPFGIRLTPAQAYAAATAYGWSVMPHDNGGFFAQSGEHQMTVVFNEDGTFWCAHVQQGPDGMPVEVSESAVVGRFAWHGKPQRPVSSEEKTR